MTRPGMPAPTGSRRTTVVLALLGLLGRRFGVALMAGLWAAPFASAARRSGGQMIANGRIPIQAIIASIEAEETAMTGGE